MKLTGMRFAVSGKFKARRWSNPVPRARIEALVRAWGGAFGPISGKTTHTLVGTNAGKTAGETLDADGFRALFAHDADDLRALFTDATARDRLALTLEVLGQVPMADLVDADLRGSTLEGVDLKEVALTGADLTGGGLPKCNLGSCTRAVFDGADLREAHLNEGALRGSFKGADLRDAELYGDFRHADFTGAHLEGAMFIQCALEGAVFDDLRGAILRSPLDGVSLKGLDLTQTEFHHALDGADLSGTTICLPNPMDLRNCDLTNARFVRSCLDAADLRGAILEGTDFSEASLAFTRFGPPKGTGKAGKAVKKLLKTFHDRDFHTTVNVVLEEAVVQVMIHTSRYGNPDWIRWSLRGQSASGRSEDFEDICRWLSDGEVKLEGMTAGMRRDAWPPSPVKPKETRALAMAAWCELFDVAPTDGTAARQKAKRGLAAHQTSLDAAGEAELLALVREDPDDLERWKVYADWLTEQGDVRGQIILREHAEPEGWERKELADRLVRAHGDVILGELASMQGAAFRFRNAFIDEIVLRASKNAVKLCGILATHPATRMTRVLTSDTVARKVVDPLFELAAALPIRRFSLAWTQFDEPERLAPLTHLRELVLSGTGVSDLAPVAALEHLELLDLTRMRHAAGALSLAPVAHLPLKTVIVRDTRIADPEVLEALEARGVKVDRRRS